MILGVVYDGYTGVHDDERRTLTPVFNMDLPGFGVAKQVRVLDVKKDTILGKHYHPYAEMHCVIVGSAIFTLTDPKTGEVETYALAPGKRLLIPAFVKHEASVPKGSLLLGLTEEKYTTPEECDFN